MKKMKFESSIILPEDTEQEDGAFGCIVGEGLWYYDALDSQTKYPKIYKKLLESAKRRIYIWDTYVDTEDSILFENIDKKVEVRCLFSWGIQGEQLIPANKQRFFDETGKHQKSKGFSWETRVWNKKTGGKLFHERYLFAQKSATNNQWVSTGATKG